MDEGFLTEVWVIPCKGVGGFKTAVLAQMTTSLQLHSWGPDPLQLVDFPQTVNPPASAFRAPQ